jgi:hemolysin III
MSPGEIYPVLVFRNPVSAGTHLLWCLWGIYLTALLWRLTRGDRTRQLSVAIFGLCVCLLYGASGTYHSLRVDPRTDFRVTQRVLDYFRLLDHSAIYLLIAGTYTPVFAVLLRGRLRTVMLALVWGLAAVGIACKWLLTAPPYGVTVGIYIGMGWTGLLPLYYLVKAVGWRAMGIGLLGGVLYTAGGVFDAIRWPVIIPGVIGWHEVLHVLDMGGTLAHVFFIFRYVIPFQGKPAVV